MLNSCLLYPIIKIQSYGIYKDIKYAKNLNNVSNQNVNETKRARFTTFALSIVHNLCRTAAVYLELNQNTNVTINHQRAIRIKSNMTILDFFISRQKKTSHCREVILAAGYALQWQLPLQRSLNKSQCMDCPPGQKKKVAVVERRPLRRSGCQRRLNYTYYMAESVFATRLVNLFFRKKKITSESFDNDNKLIFKIFFAFCSGFSQGPTEERWKRL